MSFRHDYRLDVLDRAMMMFLEQKEEEERERERERARERQREQELERERQREQERLRLIEQERERQRQQELERERLRKQELERERQREQERLRVLEQERERLRQQELERERLRKQELERERQREQERLRVLEQEREMQRQQELERERLRKQELERERQREQERLRLLEQEREQQRLQELERERLRAQELEWERREREQERLRLLEQEREQQRLQELERERLREQERLRLLEQERERLRQQELERERQREQERLRLLELEREMQRQVQLQQERERQQALERERQRQQERQMQRMEEQREQLRAKQQIQTTEIQSSVQLTTEEIKRLKLNKQDREEQQEEERDEERQTAKNVIIGVVQTVSSLQSLQQLLLEEEKEEEREKKKYPVVVVGCGASGIAALAKLTEAGIPAVVVEASKRMGGRINTVNFGAGVVDLGAAWCHGEGENIVFKLANPHGLLGKPENTGNDQDWYVFSDGSLMPPGNAKAILQSINNKVNANKDGRGSIREFVRTGVREKSIIPKPKLIPINEPFLRWYEQDYHLGGREDPLAAKSLKALSKQKICEGEFWLHWKGKGFKTLLDLLLHKLPGTGTPINPNIQYNKEVVNICYPIPAPEPEDPEQTVLVKFKDGTAMKASKVIVTVPLGVLKQNYATMFTPGLPLRKIEAINNLQVFVLDKIIMEFEKAWWPEGMVNLRILWRDEDKALFQDEKWVTGIHGFRIVEHRPKVLLAWITGPLAEEMESVRDDQLSKGIHKLIKHVFALNFDVPMITKLTRSKWAAEEFAKGSFSYRGVSTERCAAASAEVLAEPLDVGGTPVVFFAGEATSKDWHGHVHGAVQAGFREADNVIKSMPK